MKRILEAREDLKAYKKILINLGTYSDNFPMTGVEDMYNKLLKNGKKSVPANDLAVRILNYVFDENDSCPANTQKFLNMRFTSLPLMLRPTYKAGEEIKVAFWLNNNGIISDKIKSLVNFEGKSTGKWVDEEGNKVTLEKKVVDNG